MNKKEQHFLGTEASPRLARIAYEGYLEAGKARGIRQRFVAGSALDAAYQRGWIERTTELEAA